MSQIELNRRLDTAVYNNDFEEMERLLNAGADPNMSTTKSGYPLLHDATRAKAVKLLAMFGADLNIRNKHGNNALHDAIAAWKGLEVVRILIDHGANVNDKIPGGFTTLHLAIAKGRDKNKKLLMELIEAGSEVVSPSPYTRYHNEIGEMYPLDLASAAFQQGYVKAAYLLAKYHLLKTFVYERKNKPILQPKEWTDQKMIKIKKECNAELEEMHQEVICGYHLTELIVPNLLSHFPNSVSWKLTKRKYKQYVNYKDIIFRRIVPAKERVQLLKNLKNIRLAVAREDGKYIELNIDCIHLVTDKMPNNDLANFIEAFKVKS